MTEQHENHADAAAGRQRPHALARLWRRLIIGTFAVFILVPVLAAGAVLGLLANSDGRAWLFTQAEKTAASAGIEVDIGTVTGDLLSRVDVDRLRVALPSGVSVDAKGIELGWDGAALLDCRFLVDRMSVASLDIDLPAIGSEGSQTAVNDPGANPFQPVIDLLEDGPRQIALPVSVSIREAAIARIGIARDGMALTPGLALTLSALWPADPSAERALDLALSDEGGTVTADLELDIASNLASADLDIAAADRNGTFIAGLANLAAPQPVAVVLAGRAGNRQWQGQLEVVADGLGRVRGPITLDARNSARIAAEVDLDIGLDGLPYPALEPLIGRDIGLSAIMAADLGEHSLTIERMAFETVAIGAGLSGRFTGEGAASIAGEIDLVGTRDGFGFVPGLAFDGAALSFDSRYEALTGLVASATLTGERIVFEDAAVERATLNIGPDATLDPAAGLALSAPFKVDLTGLETGIAAAQDALSALLPGGTKTLAIAGRIDASESFQSIDAELEPIALREGTIGLKGGLGPQGPRGALTVTQVPLSLLATAGGAGAEHLPLTSGRLDGSVSVSPGPGGELSAFASLEAGDLIWTMPQAEALIGPRLTLEAEVDDLAQAAALQGVRASVQAQQVSARVTPDGPTRADWTVALADSGSINAMLDGPLSLTGSVEMIAEAETSAIRITAAQSSSETPLRVRNLTLEELTLETLINGADSRAESTVLRTAYGGIPVEAELDRIGFEGGIAVANADIAIGRNRIDITEAGLAVENITGSLSATLSDWESLSTVAGLAPLPVDGALDLTLNASGSLSAPQADLGSRSSRLVLAGSAFTGLDARVTVAQQSPDQLALTATLNSRVALPAAVNEKPVRLDLNTLIRPGQGDGAETLIDVTRLDASAGDFAMALQETLRVSLGETSQRLAGLNLAIAEGTLRGSASRDGNDLTAALELAGITLPAFNRLIPGLVPVEGSLNGDLTASLRADTAQARSSLSLGGVTMDELAANGLGPFGLGLEVVWDGRRADLRFDGTAEGVAADAFDLQGSISVPVALARGPDGAVAGMDFDPNARIETDIDGRLALAVLNNLVEADGHRIDGAVSIDLQGGGTLQRRDLLGTVILEDGRYENLMHGVLVEDIEGRLIGTEGGLTVERFEGRAINGGTVSLSGDVGYGQPMDLDLTATVSQAQLVSSDIFTGIFDGAASVTGTALDNLVEGTIQIVRADIRIPDRLPGSVQTIEVIEIERPEDGTAIDIEADGVRALDPDLDPGTGEGSEEELVVTLLDVTIEAPNQVFVRGLGLDLEMAGSVAATGNVEEPVIEGEMALRRGTLDLLGQRWEFSEGVLRLLPEREPELDIRAERAVGDVTAIISVTGPVSDPVLTLGSQPPLPAEEVAARVLFGREARELSAIQAIQATELLARLAGRSEGGVISTARARLGLDRLSVDEGDDGAALTAGRYINDRVYVGLSQGLGADGSEVTIEVDLTDIIKLESRVGASESSTIGVSVEWDY